MPMYPGLRTCPLAYVSHDHKQLLTVQLSRTINYREVVSTLLKGISTLGGSYADEITGLDTYTYN